MKVVFFTADSNGGYPVPAVRGGAVSTLIEHLVSENNRKQLFNMTIVSLFDKEAVLKSSQYPNINFIWIRVPFFFRWLDKLLFFIVLHCFPNKKAISYRSVFSLLFYIVKSSIQLKRIAPDKIILENNIPLAWIVRFSKYTGEVWYHLHNIPRTNAKCKQVFEKCKYLCVSKYVAEEIEKDANPIGPVAKENIKILYNCIDTELFKQQKVESDFLREKYSINDTDKVILFVGRLSAEKGVDKVMEAVKLLNDKSVKLLIAGSLLSNANIKDAYQNKLSALATELKDNILFTGYVPQTELPKFYNMADISVLPSVWEEPAGLTMVESMACGLPVITTQSGGIPEYVANCGIVLPVDDNLSRNIAEKIDILFANDALRKSLSENAVKRSNENFSSKNYLDYFYNSIL